MLEHHGYERSGRCTVSPRRDGDALVLHVAGDLDVLTAPTLMTHLDVALSGGTALLIVDLLDVTFLSSAGISVLVETHRLTEPAGVSLRVVAEGIEAEAEGRQLYKLGCGWGQGYAYGRPVCFSEQAEGGA